MCCGVLAISWRLLGGFGDFLALSRKKVNKRR